MHLRVAKYLLDIIPPLPSRWPCTIPATAPAAPWLISSASLASSLLPPCDPHGLGSSPSPHILHPSRRRLPPPGKASLEGSAHACLTLKKLLERENRAGPLITLLVDRVPQRFSRVRTHHQKRPMAARRRQNGRRGRSGRSGCNAPPVLQQGKEILDFVTLAIQPLAVVDWFLAAATGPGCPAGTASCGFCPCPTLDPPSPLPQAADP